MRRQQNGWIREMEIATRLSLHDLEIIDRYGDDVAVEQGDVLTWEGTPGRQSFFIVHGDASVVVSGAVVATLGPGDFVGEMSILDSGLRSATVRADTPMRIVVFSSAAFRSMLGEPTIARLLAFQLADRLRRVNASLPLEH